jgi:hypothetical protein
LQLLLLTFSVKKEPSLVMRIMSDHERLLDKIPVHLVNSSKQLLLRV